MGAVLLSPHKVPLASTNKVRMAGYREQLTLLWKKTAGALDYGAQDLFTQNLPYPFVPLAPYIWNSDGTERRWRRDLRTQATTPDPALMRYAILLAAVSGATDPPGNGSLPLNTTWTALAWGDIDKYTGEITVGSSNQIETEPADPPGSDQFILNYVPYTTSPFSEGSSELTEWKRWDGQGHWTVIDKRSYPPHSLWWPDDGVGFWFPASYIVQVELTAETSIHDAISDAVAVYNGSAGISGLGSDQEFKYDASGSVVAGSIKYVGGSTLRYGYGLDAGMSGQLGKGIATDTYGESDTKDWARITGAYYFINSNKWYIHEITFDGMNNIVAETKTPQAPLHGYLELNPGPWKNARAVLGDPDGSVTTPAPFPELPPHIRDAGTDTQDAGTNTQDAGKS